MVCTADGAFLHVDERLALSGPPATVRLTHSGAEGSSGAPMTVTGWAGPWPVDERWWAPGEANRSVRLQLGVADGSALLVAGRDGTWWLEAVYD
jgi:protein ImuB